MTVRENAIFYEKLRKIKINMWKKFSTGVYNNDIDTRQPKKHAGLRWCIDLAINACILKKCI